eukprot:CAMPEP_0183509224 /NCGR_PEP_ID=MMETSP0371-20130417/9445_1 /TAXON_ID=268820 /ORGANISM="Peridinium aciculiferum, Strain PAER-2" /LENGTH=54 /DNA_ID=CAMNT_0025705783 /DNA_START=119 /DNA_END=280 /DNA_ORIENTATION=-
MARAWSAEQKTTTSFDRRRNARKSTATQMSHLAALAGRIRVDTRVPRKPPGTRD